VTHYRVIQERWSQIWPHSGRTVERLDTQDKREADLPAGNGYAFIIDWVPA
jgi:hypothetical protein